MDGPVVCCFCGNDEEIEQRGPEWFCPRCSRMWLVLNHNDKQFLRSIKIQAS